MIVIATKTVKSAASMGIHLSERCAKFTVPASAASSKTLIN